MRDDEFRAWMVSQGQAPSSVSTRLSDARRIERHYGDLDEAYAADRFATILEDFSYSTNDQASGRANPSRLQIDGNIYESLSSYRTALSTYSRFLESGSEPSQADRIRSFVLSNYIEPARARGDAQVQVRSGDVHDKMGLHQAMPSVCSAIGGQKFWEIAQVRQVGREGPERSSTVVFTYELAPAGPFNVERAEAILRLRYGSPDVDSAKMISFVVPDGRAIALQRDIAKVQVWLEDDAGSGSPPVQQMQHYPPERGRHSNLPARLSHKPDATARANGAPRAVLSARTNNEPEFLKLLEWYESKAGGLNRSALEKMKTFFLAQYPDFEPECFEAMSGAYYDEERGYKEQLLASARDALATEGISDQELGGRFLDLLIGPVSGLLGWRTDARIKKMRTANPGALEAAAGELIRSDAPLPDAVAKFVQRTWPVLSGGQEKSQPYSESRNIPSMVAALARPSEAYGINTSPVMKASAALLGKPLLGYNPLTAEEYGAVLEMARAIFDVMRDEWNWKPRDLWDVQGFIWAVNRTDNPALEDGATDPVVNGASTPSPTNLILYGPPGTGKTYSTAEEAVRLCDGSTPSDREELKARYDALLEAGQIGFVTFHQSYAYEDFVEGLRPTTDVGEGPGQTSAGFRLEPRKGVFRELSALAEQARKTAGRSAGLSLEGRRFFKMSLGRAGIEEHIYEAAIEGGYIVLGYGGEVDWSDPKYDDFRAIFGRVNELEPGTNATHGNISQLSRFRGDMREGDIVVVSEGNSLFRAIGEITGPYRYEPTGERSYNHRRDVKWHLVLDEPLPVESIYDGRFTMTSCYRLKDAKVKHEALSRMLPGEGASASGSPDQFVLVIDEINRANISKVFGELITLIEPDKRLGASNALRVKLPYSGDTFGVPSNLHIVGTMNTADRSIALLDTALRRRFRFKELMPLPNLLSEDVCGINVRSLLEALNDRIEYLFDREHQIGHAYFLGCGSKPAIDETMRTKIIPLLAEYFYENWERVRQVLGETADEGGFIIRKQLSPLGGGESEFSNERWRYSVRDDFDVGAYRQLTG